MSSKAHLVLLCITGLYLAALAARNGSLVLLSLPFLFYLAAGLLSYPQEVRLRVSRSLSHSRCDSGIPVTQTITIENEGPHVPCLRLSGELRPEIHLIQGDLGQPLSLPAGQKAEWTYTFSAPRGLYRWSGVTLVASDPFGLFERRVELEAESQALVLPQPVPLRRLPIHLSQTLRTVGPNLSRLPGSGIDFWGVREYHPGDSLRSIHWRSAARHPQQLFTKEFEREEMANVGLLLDARLAANRSQDGNSLLEYSIQAAASLAKSLLRAGNRVSLLVLGERILRVFPGTGKHQLVKILDCLAGCEPGEKVSFYSLKYLPTRLFPANSMVILVSPLRLDDFPAVARLRAEGYRVLLVSPDPVRFSAPSGPVDPVDSLAVRAARLERVILLRRIRQIGVDVIDWPVDEPLARQIGQIRANHGGRR